MIPAFQQVGGQYRGVLLLPDVLDGNGRPYPAVITFATYVTADAAVRAAHRILRRGSL